MKKKISVMSGRCQDCEQEEWTMSIATTHGPLYLCRQCGLDTMDNRESKDKRAALAYGKLISKVYGAAS